MLSSFSPQRQHMLFPQPRRPFSMCFIASFFQFRCYPHWEPFPDHPTLLFPVSCSFLWHLSQFTFLCWFIFSFFVCLPPLDSKFHRTRATFLLSTHIYLAYHSTSLKEGTLKIIVGQMNKETDSLKKAGVLFPMLTLAPQSLYKIISSSEKPLFCWSQLNNSRNIFSRLPPIR